MLQRSLEDLISIYLNKGKPALEKKLVKLRDKAITSEDLLKFYVRKEAVNEFLQKEQGILPKLSQFSTIEDLSDLAFNEFIHIRGVGEASINAWVLHQAYLRDIDPEANCFFCLSRHSKSCLNKHKIPEKSIVKYVKSLHKDLHPLNNIEIVDFINYVDKNKRLEDILP